MNLTSDLVNLIGRLIPTQTRIVVRGARQELPALAHTMDVDSIHGILREAEAGNCSRLFALYRDILSSHSHLQTEAFKRKLAVLSEPLTLIPDDPKNPAQVAHAKAVCEHLCARPGWIDFLSHLLDSSLYPISLSERLYVPSVREGWRYEIAALNPVPATHLAWPEGCLSIRETDEFGNFTGSHWQPDVRRHVQHRAHLLTSVPDWWGGPMRSVLFWWFFATCDRDWWARFLDRFGSPFLEGRYDSSDERGRYELEHAFSFATRVGGIVLSEGAAVQMHQANTSQGGDAFQAFAEFANREISKLIVGQTSSSDIQQEGGIGGGQGKGQADVRDDIRRFDSTRLAHTIKTQILAPLWQLNGWDVPIPSVTFGAVSEDEAEITGTLLLALRQAGIVLTQDGLDSISARLGLGFEFAPDPAPSPFALSAIPNRRPALLPTVARRAARQRQARSAVDALALSASPKLARIMSAQAAEFAAAIEASGSPEEAAENIAALVAASDPTTAAELIENFLSASSVNAVISLDN